MTLSIERARSRGPVTWLTLLGILLLPAVVGGMLVAALYNPTERLDSMTAAIVNLDEPVTIDDQYTPLGRQLAAGLVEGSDELDSNLTWVISNESDAASGLADGTYQAVVTIPEEFSAAATSAGQALGGGDVTPERTEITVVTPPDGRLADDLITGQIAAVAASTMGSMLSEATLGSVFVGFATIGDQLGEAADGAAQLAEGASDAATGAAEIPGGATQLAAGAAQLGDGASELGDGLGTIASSTREVADGANALGAGLRAGATALERDGIVPAELTGAATGAALASGGVSDGVAGLADGLAGLAAMCPPEAGEEFCAQLAGAAQGAEGLRTPAAQAAQAAAGTSAGLDQLAEQAPAALAAQLREAGAGANEIGSGLGLLAQGVDQSAAGARALSSGASGLGDGATQLASGADELVSGLEQLASGTDELASGLDLAATSLPSFSDEESETLASVLADPVGSNTGSSTIFGPTAIPLLSTVVLWFGGLASFVVLRATSASILTSRSASAALAWRSFWPAAAIGAGQGVLVALIVQIVARYDLVAWWGFAGIAVLAGVAFAAVNQALVAVFGGAGRWVSALVGVLVVATGLISTVPGWLASLGAAMPTAPALAGLIEASGGAAAGLVVWGVLSLVVTTLVVALRRTTSAKAVLAAA